MVKYIKSDDLLDFGADYSNEDLLDNLVSRIDEVDKSIAKLKKAAMYADASTKTSEYNRLMREIDKLNQKRDRLSAKATKLANKINPNYVPDTYPIQSSTDLSHHYPCIDACKDKDLLYQQLSNKELDLIEYVLDAYERGKLDFNIERYADDGTPKFDGWCEVYIKDKSYKPVDNDKFIESLIIKWYESYENTDFLIDVIRDFCAK